MNKAIENNMDNYFNKLIKSSQKQDTNFLNSNFIKNNIIIIGLIIITIILFLFNIMSKDYKKNKITKKDDNDETLEYDRNELLNIINELEELTSNHIELQNEIKNNKIKNSESHTGYQNINNIQRQTTNINGYLVESPFI